MKSLFQTPKRETFNVKWEFFNVKWETFNVKWEFFNVKKLNKLNQKQRIFNFISIINKNGNKTILIP